MTRKANNEIRCMMKERGIFMWQVAQELGVSEPQFVRWMRVPLSPERERLILEAIDKLAKEG